MSLHPVIRRLLAGFMLFVFAFSIMPKKTLHDLVANHRDQRAAISSSHHTNVAADGFMCKCDNLVAESPFTGDATVFELSPVRSYAVQESTEPYCFYASSCFFFSLRGPPAMA